MNFTESIEVGNLQVGDIVKKYEGGTSVNSPIGIILKTKADKALTLSLSEDKKNVELSVFNTILDDNDLECIMNSEQIQEFIRDLKQLERQLIKE